MTPTGSVHFKTIMEPCRTLLAQGQTHPHLWLLRAGTAGTQKQIAHITLRGSDSHVFKTLANVPPHLAAKHGSEGLSNPLDRPCCAFQESDRSPL